MKDHDQQASASENFAGPIDFETPRPDLPVHFLNFQKPCLTYSSTEISLLYPTLTYWRVSSSPPGRVARAGRTGTAYSLVSPEEMAHLLDLHVFLGRPLNLVELGVKVDADSDGSLGEVPQSLVDDEAVDVDQIIRENVELVSSVH